MEEMEGCDRLHAVFITYEYVMQQKKASLDTLVSRKIDESSRYNLQILWHTAANFTFGEKSQQ